jgi:hypothetical protein
VAGGLQQVAENRGEGTRGLLNAMRQLIGMYAIRAHIGDQRLGRLTTRVMFSLVAWLVELLRFLERCRVHWGGKPSRV